MTSEIRANTIKNRVGLGTVSFTDTGAIVSGIVTANSFSGSISGTTGTFSDNVNISSNKKLTLNNPGFEIYHDNSNAFLDNNVGHLYIRNDVDGDTNSHIYIQAKSGENGVSVGNDGSVVLYYDNNPKFQTTNTGTYTTGIGTFTDKISVIGSQSSMLTSNQLIFDRAGTSYVDNSNDSGALSFRIGSSYTVGLFIDSSANVSIPSKLMHHGDTHTFMEFGSDTISFDTGGSERLRITSGGQVNIGGSTQTSKTLYVDGTIEATSNLTCVNQIYLSGTAPQLVFTDTNQDSDYTIKNDGGQLTFIDRTNSNAVRMYANTGGFGGDRLYIANDIVHTGDTNTKIEFGTGTIDLDSSNIKLGTGTRTLYYSRSVAAAINSTTEIVRFSRSNGAHSMRVSIVCSSVGFSVAKVYEITSSYNMTSSEWRVARPISSTGKYDGNIELLVYTSNNIIELKLRKTSDATWGATCDIAINYTGSLSTAVTITGKTGTGSDTTFYDVLEEGFGLFDVGNGQTALTHPKYQPAFGVHSGSSYFTHGSDTGTINVTTLSTVLFDTTSSYDTSTNIYTAPVPGKYFMSFMFDYKCTSGYIVILLSKAVGNGSFASYGKLKSGPPQQSTTYSNGQAIIGIMELDKGDRVRPQVQVNYSGNQLVNCHWSGYLLG